MQADRVWVEEGLSGVQGERVRGSGLRGLWRRVLGQMVWVEGVWSHWSQGSKVLHNDCRAAEKFNHTVQLYLH